MAMSWVFGGILAVRNSCYRLEGLVPNGLETAPVREPVKYDYTSNFLERSFWAAIFQPQKMA